MTRHVVARLDSRRRFSGSLGVFPHSYPEGGEWFVLMRDWWDEFDEEYEKEKK